ncbi:MAG TPA: hypothetical protein VM491_19860, partial [Burkholderiaceae bacterium]|nr:hypothetical protein [Burkholderiaceae bacterium]
VFSSGPVRVNASGPVALAGDSGIRARGAAGTVSITSGAGDVTTSLGAIVAEASVQLASGARLVIGRGGIQVTATGANAMLSGRQGVQLDGDAETAAGLIQVSSDDGSVAQLVSPAGNDDNSTLHAGRDPARSRIVVDAQQDVTLGELIAQQEIVVTSAAGNVVLARGLGGEATGYDRFDAGYLENVQQRPNVGRLEITASQGSVELNGLNLDGNPAPTDTRPGLAVTAAQRIISNEQIAVNKGDIELRSTRGQGTDGVYLGHNVYSRGWDSVGANGQRGGGDDQKIGYAIRIDGARLALFANRSTEVASVPSGNLVFPVGGEPGSSLRNSGEATDPPKDISKIIIGNNTANYRDAPNQSVLVPVTTAQPPRIELSVGELAGLQMPGGTPRPLRVDETIANTGAAVPGQPSLVNLSQVGNTFGTQGIGLKLLAFLSAPDSTTRVINSEPHAGGFNAPFIDALALEPPVDLPREFSRTVPLVPLDAASLPLTATPVAHRIDYRVVDDPADNAVTVTILSVTPLAAVPGTPAAYLVPGPSEGSGVIITSGLVTQVQFRNYALHDPGSAAAVGLAGMLRGDAAPLSAGTNFQVSRVEFADPADPAFTVERMQYSLSRVVFISRPEFTDGTRVFIYDGVISNRGGTLQSQFDTTRVAPTPANLGGDTVGPMNNTATGFAGVGTGFGSLASGSTAAPGTVAAVQLPAPTLTAPPPDAGPPAGPVTVPGPGGPGPGPAPGTGVGSDGGP